MHIRIQSIHLIGWTLSMWTSLFCDTDLDADIDRSISMSLHAQIETLKHLQWSWLKVHSNIHLSVCKVLFIPKMVFSIRFLDSLKNSCALTCILCVSDSGPQCNKHNSYWYGGQYQDRQTVLGVWYGPYNWYFSRLRLYHFHWSVRRPFDNLYILILTSISVAII